MRVENTYGADNDEKNYKIYTPRVGLIQDEDLLLFGYSRLKISDFIREFHLYDML